MKTLQTPTAAEIYKQLCSGKPDAVLLSNDDNGTRCSIGGRIAAHTDYCISLNRAGKKFWVSSDSPREFAVLLDRGGPQRSVRTVLYLDDEPIPAIEYDQANELNSQLNGHITLIAYDDYGCPAAVQALFASDGQSSLVLEADEKIVTHLHLCRELIEGK